jgi:hypothetical protein
MSEAALDHNPDPAILVKIVHDTAEAEYKVKSKAPLEKLIE